MLIVTHIMMVVRFTLFIYLWVGTLADRTHYRIGSLDPLMLDSFKTSVNGEILYENRVIGSKGNWRKYEVISADEILYLENTTLFHRFTHSPSYDHSLACNVSCFTFDRLSRRIIWVDTTSSRLKGSDEEGIQPLLLPDCLDISAYADTLLVLHANHTLTLNNNPILKKADEIPLIVFLPYSNRYVMGEVGQYTILMYSISISLVIVFRFVLIRFGKQRGEDVSREMLTLLPLIRDKEQHCEHSSNV